MEAYRVETTLTADGSLVLDRLPFRASDRVEVIVLAASRPEIRTGGHPASATASRVDRPVRPVAEDTCDVGS